MKENKKKKKLKTEKKLQQKNRQNPYHAINKTN